MARRKKTTTDNETLSKETEQETVFKDLVSEDAINEITSEKAIDKGVKGVVDLNEVKAEAERAKAERKALEAERKEIRVGDKVKIKPNVETDTLGRRIHNGIRNYTYNVLTVRPDGFISIECLTYAFLVRKDQVNKI